MSPARDGEGRVDASTRCLLTVPDAPSIVPTHSKRFASDLGNADYQRIVSSVQKRQATYHIQYQEKKTSRNKPFSIRDTSETKVRTMRVINSFPSLGQQRISYKVGAQRLRTDRFVTLTAPSPEFTDEAILGELRGGARELVSCSILCYRNRGLRCGGGGRQRTRGDQLIDGWRKRGVTVTTRWFVFDGSREVQGRFSTQGRLMVSGKHSSWELRNLSDSKTQTAARCLRRRTTNYNVHLQSDDVRAWARQPGLYLG